MDTHVLNELAGGFYPLRFVFGGDMSVESHGETNPCFFDDILLFFILKKFGHVIV